MSGDSGLADARERLAPYAQSFTEPEAGRIDAAIAVSALAEAAAALVANGEWHLAAITGLDPGAPADLEALYHFSNGPAVVTLRARLPRIAPEVPSLCAAMPNAGFFERELSEMFGITVRGAPDASLLFLPDDWPAGVYPLRKDAVLPPAEGGPHA